MMLFYHFIVFNGCIWLKPTAGSNCRSSSLRGGEEREPVQSASEGTKQTGELVNWIASFLAMTGKR